MKHLFSLLSLLTLATATFASPLALTTHSTIYESDQSAASSSFLFNIKAKTDIVVYGLDINIATTNRHGFRVYTKSGSFKGYANNNNSSNNEDAWQLVLNSTVVGRGVDQPTPILMEGWSPVVVPMGQKQAFYVAFNGPYMRFSQFNATGDRLYYINQDLVIYGRGASKEKGWDGALVRPRVFNGGVKYAIGEETSATPTTAPSTTKPLTTPSPTIAMQATTQVECLPDRFDNEGMDLTLDPSVNFNRLYPGQFICNGNLQRYQFGLTPDQGHVVWIDTITNERVVVMENPNPNSVGNNDVYLTLATDATLVYHYNNAHSSNTSNGSSSTVVTLSPSQYLKHPMQTAPTRCLSNHDCPYFHLHSDGVLVLNYIAADGTGWEARNFFKAYGLVV